MPKVATATSTKKLIEVWQQHCYFELVMKDAGAALTTMSDICRQSESYSIYRHKRVYRY
jgi:hypothetical protein